MFLKKNSSNSAIKNIVTLSAYTDKKYIFKNSIFQPLHKLTYKSSNFITSYISNKDLITLTIPLSRSLPEEDIEDILEIKAYEELDLNQASNYVIAYHEDNNAEDERIFHIFVASPEVLDERFLPIKEETKYLDLVIPAPLLYKVLYSKEILQDNGVHSFIYFTQNDTFVTFYRDGEYLYSKSIDFSLEQIYDKYCEIVGEQVDKKEFFSVLETEGLKTANRAYQENFVKIFSDIFMTINDIVIYVKRAFQIDAVDHMYIGSENGPIFGLEEYSQNYLGLPSVDFNFNYHVESDEWYTDQLQTLMLLSSLEYIENDESIANLTVFPRPPSFVNRASGQFILSTLAAISIGLAYPLSYLMGAYANDVKNHVLESENTKLSQEAAKYKKILGVKKKEISILDKNIANLSKIYEGKTKTLTTIYDKKVNYRLKSGILYTIAEELNKFDVHVDQLQSDNDTIWLSLVSSDDRQLTELIKYISQKHYEELNQIDIEVIKKDPDSEYYKGLLKVELK